jgi:hypothetical protein
MIRRLTPFSPAIQTEMMVITVSIPIILGPFGEINLFNK